MLIVNPEYLELQKTKPALVRWAGALDHFRRIIESREFATPNALKQVIGSADNLGNYRYAFDIGGRKGARLIASINFEVQVLKINFIGTHTQYDKVNVHTVDEG